jgi:hypothetical protein
MKDGLCFDLLVEQMDGATSSLQELRRDEWTLFDEDSV